MKCSELKFDRLFPADGLPGLGKRHWITHCYPGPQGLKFFGMAKTCPYCRIGLVPSGSSMCTRCAKKNRKQKLVPLPPSREFRKTRNRATVDNHFECPHCKKSLTPMVNGHLRSHKNLKGKHCPGSGGAPVGGAEKARRRRGRGSVHTVGGGLPGLGKRQ